MAQRPVFVAGILLTALVPGVVGSPAAAERPGVIRPARAPAAPAWHVVKTPDPSGLYTGVLNGIACPKLTECLAVGDGSQTGSTLGTLAESWNGKSWSPMASPNPKGSEVAYPQLNAIACSSPTACTAVGTTLLLSNDFDSLVEQWSASGKKSSWKVVPSPDVAGATTTVLSAVACPGSTTCFAVGSSEVGVNGEGLPEVDTVVEQWNAGGDKAWTIVASPDVAGALQTILTGVSCLTATSCMAVGYAISTSATTAISEQWNGSDWSLVGVPAPVGGPDNELSGISCARSGGTTACYAAGRTYSSEYSLPEALVEEWNGSSWSPMTTADATGVVDNILFGIDCTSTAACTAVGESDLNESGSRKTLVERLESGTWSVLASPNASGGSSSLAAVACDGTAAAPPCQAAGQSYTLDEDHTLLESSSAGSWTLEAPGNPKAPAASYLNGVGCLGADCIAVGYSFPANSYNTVPLVIRTTGRSWVLEHPVTPAGAEQADLLGAACPAAKACVAVGYEVTGTSGQSNALVETMSGDKWAVVPTPAVPGAAAAELRSISCPSTTDCVAVGWSATSVGGPETPLAEQLTGTTWSVVATPAVTGAATAELRSVSCVSATDCDAVGAQTSSAGGALPEPLLEQMSHGSWTLRSGPALPAGSSGQLSSVSCVSVKHVTTCEAAGSEQSATDQVTALAEQGVSTTWTVEPTAAASGSFATVLQAVSCTGPTACEAAGYGYLDAGGDTTVVESFDGHGWSLVSSGAVAGNYSTGLNGIDCTATAVCVAAGSGDNGFGGTGTLVEQS